jgi:hypothetical protein
MADRKTVDVCVNTEVEWYPVLDIREAEEGESRAFAVPAALLHALRGAQDAVSATEAAIMEFITATHPDARDVADWVRDRDNAPKFQAARDAYDADHPDGPDWAQVANATRLRYLKAAGYEIR